MTTIQTLDRLARLSCLLRLTERGEVALHSEAVAIADSGHLSYREGRDLIEQARRLKNEPNSAVYRGWFAREADFCWRALQERTPTRDLYDR